MHAETAEGEPVGEGALEETVLQGALQDAGFA